MTNKQLEKLCRIWQKRLRLQDWNVRIAFEPVSDIDGAFARTRNSRTYKEAVIQMGVPDQLGKNWLGSHDTEVTLVHELLHLHASGFDERLEEKSPEYREFESMLELSAVALVGLSRKRTHGK